jgi:hypothetical protein
MVMEQERRTKTGQQKSEDSESEAKSFIVLSVTDQIRYMQFYPPYCQICC